MHADTTTFPNPTTFTELVAAVRALVAGQQRFSVEVEYREGEHGCESLGWSVYLAVQGWTLDHATPGAAYRATVDLIVGVEPSSDPDLVDVRVPA